MRGASVGARQRNGKERKGVRDSLYPEKRLNVGCMDILTVVTVAGNQLALEDRCRVKLEINLI